MSARITVEQTMFAIARGEAALRRERAILQLVRNAGVGAAWSEQRLAALEQAQNKHMARLAVALAGDRE